MELERELPDIQELVVAVEIVKSEIDHNPPSGGTWKK